MQLCEKYRPRDWADFVGQDKIIARVRQILSRPGFGDGAGEAFCLCGPTGTGKTTLAQLMARALSVKPGPGWNYIELDGEACTVDAVRALANRAEVAGLFAGVWQVFVINEAHAMTHKAVQAWLTLLERLPARWMVIFTTTDDPATDLFGSYTSPLLARCKVLKFTNQNLAQRMADRAYEIAEREGLNGQPKARYLRLLQECKNSMREALQRIDAGEMAGDNP